MRCEQFFGLSPTALQFLKENEIPPEICECCKRIFPRKFEIIGYYDGYDKHPLYQHQLKNGVANEYLQVCEFSSGPCLFLGLRIINKNGVRIDDIRWTDEEIKEHL
jgi:hypothetical protein